MKRLWIGLALLSASWLFGLSYYHDAEWWVWAALVVAGTGLFTGVSIRRPTACESAVAAIILLPAIILAPWPCRAAPLLIFAGLVLGAAPIPRRWPNVLASSTVLSGVVLTAQSLAMLGHRCATARSHELPRLFATTLLALSQLLGLNGALDGANLVLHTPRAPHRLGATWELLLDPPTLCFLTGGIVMLFVLRAATEPRLKQVRGLAKSWAALILLTAVWLPARAGVLMSMFMHRALRTEYDAPLSLMNQFWNPWLHLALLLGPVLLACRFVHMPSRGQFAAPTKRSVSIARRVAAAILILTAILLVTAGILLDPPGQRKQGRVFVDEHHSTWEPTDRPFDTNWYGHESGYNYACIYDYCSHFYEMSRLNTSVDEASLSNCDVLMVKAPTSRYGSDEVAAIKRFVEGGGGLLLVGEHTNVFNTGTFINDIARMFGFSFRYDCLFDIDTVFEQLCHPPLVPHPIIQDMPPMHFAVSCSIAPGTSLGRAVICSTGLKSLPADYHASNFYPQVEDRAEMRYGAFVQLWATRCGAGRVVAFTDSTVFSNFAAFEPGKAELMLGMLEWLNHRNRQHDPRLFMVLLGLVLLVVGLILTRKWNGASLVVLAAGMLGWSAASVSVAAVHHHLMSLPQATRPMVEVVIDRTVCDAPLSRSGFIAGARDGFGIFERWILRLGYFTSRERGTNALTGDLTVFLHPNLMVTSEFRDALVKYVASGGKVLVLDSPANAESTANSLLYPFGLAVTRSTEHSGQLRAPEGWPSIRIDSTWAIEGGEPILSVQDVPIAARARHGQGTVTVIGFGSRFADAYMGVTGDVVPDENLRKVYDLQFSIVKTAVSEPL